MDPKVFNDYREWNCWTSDRSSSHFLLFHIVSFSVPILLFYQKNEFFRAAAIEQPPEEGPQINSNKEVAISRRRHQHKS